MSKIIAVGNIFGRKEKIEITVEKERLMIVCKTYELTEELKKELDSRLERCIKTSSPVGGTYYPPENTLLAAYLGLQNNFFESEDIEIKVDGELESIPYEDGIIY